MSDFTINDPATEVFCIHMTHCLRAFQSQYYFEAGDYLGSARSCIDSIKDRSYYTRALTLVSAVYNLFYQYHLDKNED